MKKSIKRIVTDGAEDKNEVQRVARRNYPPSRLSCGQPTEPTEQRATRGQPAGTRPPLPLHPRATRGHALPCQTMPPVGVFFELLFK